MHWNLSLQRLLHIHGWISKPINTSNHLPTHQHSAPSRIFQFLKRKRFPVRKHRISELLLNKKKQMKLKTVQLTIGFQSTATPLLSRDSSSTTIINNTVYLYLHTAFTLFHGSASQNTSDLRWINELFPSISIVSFFMQTDKGITSLSRMDWNTPHVFTTRSIVFGKQLFWQILFVVFPSPFRQIMWVCTLKKKKQTVITSSYIE
jgi:hypothetical protein